MSQPTLYSWKSKYGGMEASDAKRLKALEAENQKLKKLLAEQVMDNATLKELLAAGQADSERVRRELQRPAPRRVPE